MTPILGITASSITASTLGDFESIATVTVGSGGASTIEFTSIPSTYQHLQIRLLARSTSTSSDGYIRFDGDTASNYGAHYLYGDGSSALSGANTPTSLPNAAYFATSGSGSNTFGVAVIDILDYANTNKNKTYRSLSGFDNNGSGLIVLYSGLWRSTNAIDSITLLRPPSNSFAQYTHAALYGIK